MPGIIVSRPVFNTLFKLAHEQGLSINAFLTKLLESSGQGGLSQAAAAGGEAGDVADELVSGAEVPAGARGAAAGHGERATTVAAASQQIARETAVTRPAETPGRAEPVYAQGHDAASRPPASAGAPISGSGHVTSGQPGFASAAGSANGASSAGHGPVVSAGSNGHSTAGHDAAGAGGAASAGQPAEGIWGQVVSMAGKKFATSRGKKFSYKISGEYVIVKESDARIPRSQFEKAQQMWPVSGPSRLVGVYAPSVVWSIMKEIVDQAVVPAAK